jgi:YVTN family beta-propeller protein
MSRRTIVINLMVALALLLGAAAPAYAQTVVATIPVGDEPRRVAVNEKTNRIYVANTNSDTVSVIEGATNFVGTIPVGDNPVGVAVNEKTNRIYVANLFDDTVSVIQD